LSLDPKNTKVYKPFEVPCCSGKVQFLNRLDGLIAIVKWELRNSPRRPIRVYECRLCGALHLTSQLPNSEVTDGA
jgi:hypothetical protein